MLNIVLYIQCNILQTGTINKQTQHRLACDHGPKPQAKGKGNVNMESKKLYGELRDKIAGSPEVQRKVTAHIRAKHGHSTLPSFNDDGVDEATKVQTYQDCIQAVVTGNFDALVGQTSEPRKRKVIGAAPATLQRGSDEPSAAFVPVSDPTFKINPATLRLFDAIFKAALDSPQNGALIVGPHGCGKSTLPGEFAARHNLKHLIMDCANIREPRDWFGYKTAVEGTVFWHESEFARCLAKGHHVIQFDEITRVSDAIKNTLFPLLDHRRFTYLEERGDVIRVGPGTIFFATMNEGSGYTGCTSIDLALKDRFTRRIEVNYLSTEDETEVLVARTGIKRSDAKKLVELADIIRKKATGVGATITQSVSTRQLLACAADFQQLGMDALEYTITNHFSADGASDSERAQVLQMVQGKFPAK